MTVCVGPGSFYRGAIQHFGGSRFGLACPELTVGGVSAFDAYAYSLSWTPDQIAPLNAVIIETKREDFYFQIFDEHLNKLTEPEAANREDIIARLRDRKVTFIGDGVERFLSAPTGLSIHAIIMKPHLILKIWHVAACVNLIAKRLISRNRYISALRMSV